MALAVGLKNGLSTCAPCAGMTNTLLVEHANEFKTSHLPAPNNPELICNRSTLIWLRYDPICLRQRYRP